MLFSTFLPPKAVHRDRRIDECLGVEHFPSLKPGLAHQEFPSPSPLASEEDEEEEVYDYIICGAGTAGCVLANRLSAPTSDGRRPKVLVLERGTFISDPIARIPFLSSLRLHLNFYATGIKTAPQKQLLDKRHDVWVGKLVGGGSAVNCCIYTRGSYAEFDDWKVEGWSGKDMRPYFDRSERHVPAPSSGELELRAKSQHKSVEKHASSPDNGHGYDGLWHTRSTKPIFGLSEPFLDAATQLGVPRVDDSHTESSLSSSLKGPVATGAWNVQLSQKPDGTRHSTAMAYMSDELLLQRSNLQLVVDAEVNHVHVERDESSEKGDEGPWRTKGVWVFQRGKAYYIRAKSVILASGAVFSPAILQRSGIGPTPLLKELDIKTLVNSPGVGNRFKDHVVCLLHFRIPASNSLVPLFRPTTAMHQLIKGTWQYVMQGTGWMTTAMGVETMAYLSSSDIRVESDPSIGSSSGIGTGQGLGGIRVTCPDVRAHSPDIELSLGAMWADRTMPTYYGTTDRHHGVCAFLVYLAKPSSTGSVQITSTRPDVSPAVDPAMLTEADDRRRLALAVRFSLALAAAMRHSQGFDIGPAHVPGWDSKKGGWTVGLTQDEARLKPPSPIAKSQPREREWDFVDPSRIPDQVIQDFISRESMCVQHMSCTCAMGPKEAEQQQAPASEKSSQRAPPVVDEKTLEVHGTKGLHVSDISIFPDILCVHPQAAIVATAEKLGEALRARDAQAPSAKGTKA